MGASSSRDSSSPSTSASNGQSACPVPEAARSRAVYNVYNQRIDSASCPQMVGWGAGASTVQLLQSTDNYPCACRTRATTCHWSPTSSRFRGSADPSPRSASRRPSPRAARTTTPGSTPARRCSTTVSDDLLPTGCSAKHACVDWFPAGAALKRKGKGDDVTEDDMGAVVHAHNSECRSLSTA